MKWNNRILNSIRFCRRHGKPHVMCVYSNTYGIIMSDIIIQNIYIYKLPHWITYVEHIHTNYGVSGLLSHMIWNLESDNVFKMSNLFPIFEFVSLIRICDDCHDQKGVHYIPLQCIRIVCSVVNSKKLGTDTLIIW